MVGTEYYDADGDRSGAYNAIYEEADNSAVLVAGAVGATATMPAADVMPASRTVQEVIQDAIKGGGKIFEGFTQQSQDELGELEDKQIEALQTKGDLPEGFQGLSPDDKLQTFSILQLSKRLEGLARSHDLLDEKNGPNNNRYVTFGKNFLIN